MGQHNNSVVGRVGDFFQSADEPSLQDYFALIERAIPDTLSDLSIQCELEREGVLSFQIDARALQFLLYIQIVRLEDDGLGIEARYYKLPDQEQKQGVAKRFLSDLADFCIKWGIVYVRAHANERRGAYAWARYGAMPLDSDYVKSSLLKRAQRLVSVGAWREEHRVCLAQFLHVVPHQEMMFELTQMVTSDVNFGESLLMEIGLLKAFGWEAVWAFDDEDHRKVIFRALGK